MLSLKGHDNEIELCFKENITLEEAKKAVLDLKTESKAFFEKGVLKISYSGIQLKYNEELAFSGFLKELFGENVVFAKKHRLTTAQIEYSLDDDEKICLVSYKSLRSGEYVFSRGDVLIYGDVNPGAQIKAKGNITVLGALRGNAHITDNGKVFALKMQPSQIRIGNVCSYNKMAENVGAAYVLKENGEIILQCL